ncbi:MAG TPA: PAS domain S-box protein, partial [Rhizomicrobium sp.]
MSLENDQESHKLRTLLRVGTAVAAELDLEKAVQFVTDAATELTGAAFGSFFYNVLNGNGESYMLYTLSGVPKEAFSQFPMPRNTAVFAPTFAGEGIVRSDDIMKDPRYGKSAPYHGQPKGHLPVHSYLAVPVTSRSGEVIGGLFFGHPETGKFTAEHEDIVVGIAAQAAIAIDNARLYRAAQQEIERRKKVEAILRTSNEALEASSESDHTQTKQALAKLRDSERHFKLLVQSVTDYAIYMLDPEGVVASWNAGAERIKGYKPHEIMGRNYAEFFTPEDRAAGVPGNALKVAAEHGRYESQGWRLRKGGSRFWSLAVIDAVRDEQGELLGFAKITRDMTEQREAQLRLERAQEQLAQSQKMEAIGQLTGGIAHDFNNLLGIVSGNLDLLEGLIEDNQPALHRATLARKAASRAADLTRRLLAFSSKETLKPRSMSLEHSVRNALEIAMHALGPSIRISMDITPTPNVYIDPAGLESALLNLMVNARDAMDNGGLLHVISKSVQLDESHPYVT